jgi:hypothetical protein
MVTDTLAVRVGLVYFVCVSSNGAMISTLEDLTDHSTPIGPSTPHMTPKVLLLVIYTTNGPEAIQSISEHYKAHTVVISLSNVKTLAPVIAMARNSHWV